MTTVFVSVPFVFDTELFARLIVSARHSAKMSQKELATLINRSTNYISNIEHGRVAPAGLYLYDFIALCNLLDLLPGDFFILKDKE